MRTGIPADRLRQLLLAARMTQADLARELVIDPGQVSRWCRGRSPLRDGYARAVAELLSARGVKVDVMDLANKVFFSTPMSATPEDFATDRAAAAAVFGRLCRIAEPVYWGADHIDTTEGFEAPDIATERNMIALLEAQAFVYLQLRELNQPTSCHVELGMAIARAIPVTVFAPSEDSLPYTLRRFEAIAGRAGLGRYRFYTIHTADDALRLLTIHGATLIGLTDQPEKPMELTR